ncbi:MAG: ATP-binding cassette domain-containing protein, partial [Planctomycetes bacterium]|nr:ATP-binding cassette domain-containing protein [Planctomycetota bacterium]
MLQLHGAPSPAGNVAPPRLRSELPGPIVAALASVGADPRDAVLAIATDINLTGAYLRQWVVATRTTLWVFDEGEPRPPSLAVALSEIAEFRAVAVYGSGLLQAKIGGIWLDVVRYSNREKYHFGRLAKRLGDLREGKAVELTPEDEVDPRRCAISGIVLEYPGQLSPFAVKHGAALSRVMQLMRPYWPAAFAMMVLLLATVALDMIAPRLIKYLIDHVLDPKTAGMAQPFAFLEHLTQPTHLLLVVVAAYALAQIVRAVCAIANGRIASRVGTSISFDIRTKLVAHLEQLSLAYYDKQSVGSLVGRVAYDTEAVQGFMAQLIAGFLMQILMVILAAISMYSLQPQLALWALTPAPFVIAGTLVFYRYVYPHYQRFWDRSSRQAGMLNGLLSGIRVVKSFAQEDRELKRFTASSETLRDARLRVDASASTFYPLMGLIFGVGGWIVWYVGGVKVLESNAALAGGASPDTAAGISLGTLIAFFSYLGLFYGPLSSLTNLTSWLTQFSTQMHRIFEVLDTPIAIPESRQPVTLPQVRGEIEFQGVTFGYSRQSPILKNVSFHIKPGEMIGVVGRSGSGKSTVINLISRFYDVDEGKVLIDGVEVREMRMQDLRRSIGVVLQEPFLFRGTLWDNLVYGRSDAAIEDVIAASRAGNAHDFIMRQMQAYDTWVGERGAGLSGGERQRLSIARALLCEPRILILDEATSSVDSESELAIQTALGELVKGRTSIIIAHRLSTLRTCDRILVVDDGRIAEQGSHAELMQLGGRYARLVRIQGSADEGSIDALVEQEKHAHDRSDDGSVAPSGLGAIAGHRPRWLKPEFTRIARDDRQALHISIDGETTYDGVFALRCMPVRHPDRYISLRWIVGDNREQEIGLIRDLAEWPEEAQRLIRETL